MDERLNGSGVPDTTAYKAILNAEGSDADSKATAGEIWLRETLTGSESMSLILAVNGSIATCLGLIPDINTENKITVDVNGKLMCSNAAMMQYCYTNALTEKVGDVSGKKLSDIMAKVADILRIDYVMKDLKQENEELYAELQAKKCECTSIECKRDVRQETIEKLRYEFRLQEKELEVGLLRRRIEALESRIIDGELQRVHETA